MINLSFDLSFADLYSHSGLVRIDDIFVSYLKAHSTELCGKLLEARNNPQALQDKEEAELLIEVGKVLEGFIVRLFQVEAEYEEQRAKHNELLPLYNCKRLFVQRQAVKKYKAEEAAKFDAVTLKAELTKYFATEFSEITFAKHVNSWLEKPEEFAIQIETALKYAAWATISEAGQLQHLNGIIFKTPRKFDHLNLVHLAEYDYHGAKCLLHKGAIRDRDGFKLTDHGSEIDYALDQANYCIYCHNQGKDSCSKGLKEKDGSFKVNPLGITQAGCPLEEKISEMNLLKFDGYGIAAFATAVVDNPMIAATGHRICNDCMKSCIYQKQEPVNIPEIETRTLKDVLELPYGFEIYSLLTRWNPLNIRRPLPKPESGYKILVAGLGPAGFTLSHHLLNEGHTVVAIDGLKIEPLNLEFKPIRDVHELYEELDDRVMAGFGGVAEYGITVRWNKNFLKLIRILLERRTNFALAGGVRFGSNITANHAFDAGFHHIALCMGAGKPTILDIPNALARGVRTASDFLMALQLTGAAKKDSITNLQIRLPIVVVGGGLTAIDTATESLAYYQVQVEKFLTRFEIPAKKYGEEKIMQNYKPEEKEIANEFLTHAKAIRAERKKEKPDVIDLIKSWGGVRIIYRKDITNAPSYRLNHEEVEKAFEEGIELIPNATPLAFEVDECGHIKAVKLAVGENEITIPARSVLVAAGTSPNTVLAREDSQNLKLDGKYFQALDANGAITSPEKVAKPRQPIVITSIRGDKRSISFFGDLHPSFAGNVVKAMGSAKQGYPLINKALGQIAATDKTGTEFISEIKNLLAAKVHSVEKLAPGIIEVIINSPLAAREFKPGQFFRLQNYEINATRIHNTTLAMEGLALTGAWVDAEKGLVSTIVLEMGGSSNLCTLLKPGEPVVLMGPTGTATHIPNKKNVLLIGGGLGNAVLFSIGRAAIENGCNVLYFAGYRKNADRFKTEEIEKASSLVVWCTDDKPDFQAGRTQDRVFHGNIVDAIKSYGDGLLGEQPTTLDSIDHIIAIGSDGMMAAIKEARSHQLSGLLNPAHSAIGSINSPMQCMMKEICAQCLQKHVDPKTGIETYVYSCFNQDQPLDLVDFPHLRQRLAQNSVQEKLTALWITDCLNN